MSMKAPRITACVLLASALVPVGCKREAASVNGAAASAAPQRVQIALNWKPEPEFGGFYAAQASGAYAPRGLDVEILPGGSGTPTVQMVGAGRAEFGIASADEVILARQNHNDVVAIFAGYWTNPQGPMTQPERPLNHLRDGFSHPG